MEVQEVLSSNRKRSSQDQSTKRSKRYRSSLCDCELIAPEKCDVCAKIARKIHRLYGKRLALSDIECNSKAPSESSSGSNDHILILADEACECGETSEEECQTCINFAIKMGAFVNIYSKSKDLDEIPDSERQPKYRVECPCVYLSNVGCPSCMSVIQQIQSIFSKKVYPSLRSSSLTAESALSSNITLHNVGTSSRVPSPISGISTTESPTNRTHPVIDSPRDVISAHCTQYIALDCEMVGVIDHTQKNSKGRSKMVSALARCSIVDENLKVLLDVYVQPDAPIADYRTRYSGIKKSDMKHAVSTIEARDRILDAIKGKIVIGHSIHNDFGVIGYKPSPGSYRDIVKCRRLRDMYLKKSKLTLGGAGGQGIGLKKMSAVLLNSLIQRGSHCSVEDAIHTMKLYLLVRDSWEDDISNGVTSDTICDDLVVDEHESRGDMYLEDSFWAHSTPEH